LDFWSNMEWFLWDETLTDYEIINGNTKNLVSDEIRSDVDKTDPSNPTICFGSRQKFCIYQFDELSRSFGFYGEEDQFFKFAIPDENMAPFLEEDIGRLHDFIDALVYRELDSVEPINIEPYIILLSKINEGVGWIAESKTIMGRNVLTYRSFLPDEKESAKKFFIWLFTFGMHLRGWDFDLPWAYIYKKEHTLEQEKIVERSAQWRNDFLEPFPYYLKDFLLNLPCIKYDWESGKETIAHIPSWTRRNVCPGYLDFIFCEIMKGKYCQGDASDIFIQSGYFFMRKILGFDNDRINELIQKEYPGQHNFDPTLMRRSFQIDAFAKRPDFEGNAEDFEALPESLKDQ